VSREGERSKAKIASREKQKETGKITSSGKRWERKEKDVWEKGRLKGKDAP